MPLACCIVVTVSLQKASMGHDQEDQEPCPTEAMSLTEAHEQLRRFSSVWRASGKATLTVLAFDVSKAFDNVDVEVVRGLLRQLVRSPGWRLHKVHSTVWARGAFVTRCGCIYCRPCFRAGYIGLGAVVCGTRCHLRTLLIVVARVIRSTSLSIPGFTEQCASRYIRRVFM